MMKKLLDYDCPQGNGLDKFCGIIELNKNVNERNPTSKKPAPTPEEIENLLDYDCPQGNGLDKFCGIIEFEEPTNSVDLKKQAYKRF